MAGCGGTGSQAAEPVARLVYTLNDIDRPTGLTFADFDRVEEKNIGRQLFVRSELYQYKSSALATRYGHAFGLPIEAFVGPIGQYKPNLDRDTLVILLGCVDKYTGRRELAHLLATNPYGATQVVWVDCGNLRSSGKVYCGTTNNVERLRNSFPVPRAATELPSVALLQPALLEPEADAEPDRSNLSCAELVNLRIQSLHVNKMAATIAAEYLTQLLLEHNLKTFATYFNMRPFSMRSEAIHPEVIGNLLNIAPKFLLREEKKRRREQEEQEQSIAA